MHSTTAVLGAVLLTAVAGGGPACEQTTPRPGALPIYGLTVGPPSRFVNDIQEETCYPLQRNGHAVGWVHRLHVSAAGIFVERCEHEVAADTEARRGEVVGGVTGELEELRITGATEEFQKLELPDWSIVARPTFCQGRVAYWAAVPNAPHGYDIYLQVWDLRRRVVLGRKFAHTDRLETDYSDYLPSITWAANGQYVSGGGVAVTVRAD